MCSLLISVTLKVCSLSGLTCFALSFLSACFGLGLSQTSGDSGLYVVCKRKTVCAGFVWGRLVGLPSEGQSGGDLASPQTEGCSPQPVENAHFRRSSSGAGCLPQVRSSQLQSREAAAGLGTGETSASRMQTSMEFSTPCTAPCPESRPFQRSPAGRCWRGPGPQGLTDP